jgi:hypothetical protein
MPKTILILMDDIHLEGRPDDMRKDFASKINDRINKVKADNNIPILIAAGDIGEGIMGVDWLRQFKAEIVYVTGNHEYWNHDLFEVDKEIENYIKINSLSNIHFLSNSSKVINGVRFVGGTLWTSLGNFYPWIDKNNIIKYFSAMGDFKNITAKEWYTVNNINRLKNFMLSNGVEELRFKTLIDNKLYNPLIEMEEHNKSVEYFINELSNKFNGPTVLVSHHMPAYESWLKKLKVPLEYMQGEWVNNEKYLLESAKGNVPPNKDVLMMSFYANNLKEIMQGTLAPNYWLHGHLHVSIDDIIGRTKIISSPVGYFKQSKEIKLKEIDIINEKSFIINYLKKEVESFDWAGVFLNNLRVLEKIINKFEIAISMGVLSSLDFEPLLASCQKNHENNIKELNKKIKEWLLPLYFHKNTEIDNENYDLFLIKRSLNFSEIKIKTPDLLNASVNEYSFLTEEKYRQFNKAALQHFHYKEWLKDIQKIQIQLIQYKKNFLDFLDETNK